ncbi:MAG: class I SAM-dependent methyltransferase [Clostridia bacterium]|nr:class I SAM-dependent methyltransferase [Clostridia bacterium]
MNERILNRNELRKLWLSEESIAKIHGWDFSHIEGKYREHPLPWSYADIIKKYLTPTAKILDIDTGGGEFLLSLGHPYKNTSATEGYPPNVVLCREKLGVLGIDFREASDYSSLPFDDEEFDIVINRHGSYVPSEIYRILKKGGLFITQQVGEDNDRELVRMLLPKCEKQFGGHNLALQKKLFEDAGFTALESDEAFVPLEFYDTSALVWFAKIIEWEFCGFSVEDCFDELCKVEQEIRQEGKVWGYAHRFYMVLKK